MHMGDHAIELVIQLVIGHFLPDPYTNRWTRLGKSFLPHYELLAPAGGAAEAAPEGGC
jgi:hypothetical protein